MSLSSSRTATRLLFHGIALITLVYGYRSLGNLNIDPMIRSQYGGHAQFLTFLTLAVTILTTAISLVQDLLSSWKGLKALKRALVMVALPLSITVASIYWPLIFLAPSLLAHPDLFKPPSSSSTAVVENYGLPIEVDLLLHAAPAMTLLLDFWLFEHSYSKQTVRKRGLVMVVVTAAGYASWVEHCAKHNAGNFPYPFLTKNTFVGRTVIYASASALSFLSLQLVNALHPRGKGNKEA